MNVLKFEENLKIDFFFQKRNIILIIYTIVFTSHVCIRDLFNKNLELFTF